MQIKLFIKNTTTQIAKFMGPTWGPSGSCGSPDGPHVGPMNLALWGNKAPQTKCISHRIHPLIVPSNHLSINKYSKNKVYHIYFHHDTYMSYKTHPRGKLICHTFHYDAKLLDGTCRAKLPFSLNKRCCVFQTSERTLPRTVSIDNHIFHY